MTNKTELRGIAKLIAENSLKLIEKAQQRREQAIADFFRDFNPSLDNKTFNYGVPKNDKK